MYIAQQPGHFFRNLSVLALSSFVSLSPLTPFYVPWSMNFDAMLLLDRNLFGTSWLDLERDFVFHNLQNYKSDAYAHTHKMQIPPPNLVEHLELLRKLFVCLLRYMLSYTRLLLPSWNGEREKVLHFWRADWTSTEWILFSPSSRTNRRKMK